MLITIDETSNIPLADQIAAAVRGAVIRGDFAPGDRLPPAREVATALGVNLHTVLRGYQQLREEGLVDMRRGRATTIAASADAAGLAITEHIRSLVDLARRSGLDEHDLHTAISRAFGTT
ncbi:GntR family transcriptional regulator [Actinomadura sp. NEAU-AAG7]|uniref:GntR family transcriptional regulator n=1 Tax=Actinomadura sp. NEAU-AAG7 TaxID=2839640 RepID=UPI001BE48492|nr:GntR family transcriptional regulator [Actinomadura sp. NEAU-AAG7]MBT2213528.1 GntR family transcriptional regulator [Actinomadura sp. NEAU-AAG7]